MNCEGNEKSLPWVAEFFGGDYIIYPTDFPHSLTFDLFVEEVREFLGQQGLAETFLSTGSLRGFATKFLPTPGESASNA